MSHRRILDTITDEERELAAQLYAAWVARGEPAVSIIYRAVRIAALQGFRFEDATPKVLGVLLTLAGIDSLIQPLEGKGQLRHAWSRIGQMVISLFDSTRPKEERVAARARGPLAFPAGWSLGDVLKDDAR